MACHGNGWHTVACHPPGMRKLDPASRLSPWEQVAQMLRAEIAAGRYEDNPMPSLDQLAGELGINRKTVRKAYLALKEEGLVETLDGRGYFAR